MDTFLLTGYKKKDFEKLEIFFGDVRDFDSVSHAMKKSDYVFHLAALIAIPYSYRSPSSYIDTNITGTLNVMQAAKVNNIKKVTGSIIIETSKIFIESNLDKKENNNIITSSSNQIKSTLLN